MDHPIGTERMSTEASHLRAIVVLLQSGKPNIFIIKIAPNSYYCVRLASSFRGEHIGSQDSSYPFHAKLSTIWREQNEIDAFVS